MVPRTLRPIRFLRERARAGEAAMGPAVRKGATGAPLTTIAWQKLRNLLFRIPVVVGAAVRTEAPLRKQTL